VVSEGGPAHSPAFDRLAGQSAPMVEVRRLGTLAARSGATVLLLGESGTGKELLARAIHEASSRQSGPFVAVNCAAVPDGLLEAEFFGYEEGAFTGARRGGKPGRFELAQGGTLFLDEVGELAPLLQAKLLRVLQEREVERVGSTRTRRLDVRVIAASNRNLQEMVTAATFRADLFYRLNVLTLTLPPLRERPEDIPCLASRLLAKMAPVSPPRLSAEVLERLQRYAWPGNVRELENALERALALDPGPVIGPEHLPPHLVHPSPAGGPWRRCRRDAERHALMGALEQAGGNKAAAARLLGISRSRLYEKLSELRQ